LGAAVSGPPRRQFTASLFMSLQRLIPDLLWLDGRFVAGQGVEYDTATGRIVRIAPEAELAAKAVRLRERALMPGLINVHSHAFQRLIRGRTQWRGSEPASDFWSWRDAMYAALQQLSPDDIYAASRLCFIEMLRSGITSVGEFHYLHNDQDGKPYANRAELALRVIAAANDAGIRIVLLNSAYATGGIREPLRPEQRRFATPDLGSLLATTEALRAQLVSGTASIGLAPHSVRAVPRSWLEEVAVYARDEGLVLHMHVSEQQAEVDACERAYGRRPVELLEETGVLSPTFTGVHCTHMTPDEVELFRASGAIVAACPGTERDLGDGFLSASALMEAGVPIALGTDSQTVIDLWEEMRLVEYNERLRRERRALLTTQVGDRHEVAPVLIEMGTISGARSLGIDAGRLSAGSVADFVAIDLGHIALAGYTVDSLAPCLALSAPAAVVTDVWVAGVKRVEDSVHPDEETAMQAFASVLAVK
jgi:formimidoylglutamate deiminase